MTLTPDTTLGPYRIVSQLGSGGMGVVYLAQDPRLKRTVAIKLLPPDLTRDETAKQRFLQEAKAASALDHPNICTIHEINETDDGQLHLVMAHYEGETLKERIARGPLDLDDAIDIATQPPVVSQAEIDTTRGSCAGAEENLMTKLRTIVTWMLPLAVVAAVAALSGATNASRSEPGLQTGDGRDVAESEPERLGGLAGHDEEPGV